MYLARTSGGNGEEAELRTNKEKLGFKVIWSEPVHRFFETRQVRCCCDVLGPNNRDASKHLGLQKSRQRTQNTTPKIYVPWPADEPTAVGEAFGDYAGLEVTTLCWAVKNHTCRPSRAIPR